MTSPQIHELSFSGWSVETDTDVSRVGTRHYLAVYGVDDDNGMTRYQFVYMSSAEAWALGKDLLERAQSDPDYMDPEE